MSSDKSLVATFEGKIIFPAQTKVCSRRFYSSLYQTLPQKSVAKGYSTWNFHDELWSLFSTQSVEFGKEVGVMEGIDAEPIVAMDA